MNLRDLNIVSILAVVFGLVVFIIDTVKKSRMLYYSSNKYEEKMINYPLHTKFHVSEITQNDIEYIHLSYNRYNCYAAYITTAVIVVMMALKIDASKGFGFAFLSYVGATVAANWLSYKKIEKHKLNYNIKH